MPMAAFLNNVTLTVQNKLIMKYGFEVRSVKYLVQDIAVIHPLVVA